MRTLADLGFLEGVTGDFGNPSERSERALRGSGLIRENEIARIWLEEGHKTTSK